MPKHVVVVDDDKEARKIITLALSGHDIEVSTASNGQQLQEILQAEPMLLPDLIILDVLIPGEDGYQICQGLRRNPRTLHIPIIIITAHAEDIYERISEDLGAAQHITKPFHPLELAEHVKSLLELE